MKTTRLFAILFSLTAFALISLGANAWAQDNDQDGLLPKTASKKIQLHVSNGVGEGFFDNSPADSASSGTEFTGTLSYNEDCKCKDCSGAAKDCAAHVVRSGDVGYVAKNKKGTYSSDGGDYWSCQPPASDCYVIIQR